MRSFMLAWIVLVVAGQSAPAHWRQFRGSDTRSVSNETGLPERFNAETGENVAWRVPLPGRGASGPIVVGDRVIVTASSGPRQDRLHVLCFDAATGDCQWHRQLWATGSTVVNAFGAVAAPTPASDGELIFAFFSSNDLACFDLAGNLKWFRGLTFESPTTRNDVGMASSPLVVGGVVVVQMENQGASYAVGIDRETGQTAWSIDRVPGAMWTSPTLLPGDTPDQSLVLLQGRDTVSAHDPRSGAVVWSYEIACHSTSSATADGANVFLQAGGLNSLQSNQSTGDAKLLWSELKLSSGAPSPVVHEGRVYVLRSA
ncbi:MAG: PQQ-binding-like beta-propeller repeat protein, partial [Patescibacteria group bacterium]|nr:PQQ-binding-like beta-propeller repeat protein [Patescibacteria group bacterium]